MCKTELLSLFSQLIAAVTLMLALHVHLLARIGSRLDFT